MTINLGFWILGSYNSYALLTELTIIPLAAYWVYYLFRSWKFAVIVLFLFVGTLILEAVFQPSVHSSSLWALHIIKGLL